MPFDPVFAHDVLIPLNTTAYQLSWDQQLKFPAGLAADRHRHGGPIHYQSGDGLRARENRYLRG